MTLIAPTHQALRHLHRLCAPMTLSVRTIETQSRCSILLIHRDHASQPHARPSISPRPFGTLSARRQRHQADSAQPNPSALPDITNYYTLFPATLPQGPPPRGPFTVPVARLKREFLQLQAQHHPDKYATSASARTKSLALSSLLNTAYKTLSDPLLRARYLLHHNYGIDITAEDNSAHGNLTDQETLIDVMEVQEAIEEAHSHDQIDALKAENLARIDATEKLLSEAFAREDVEAAKTECIRLNYWRGLQQGLHDWEPGKDVRLVH